MTSTVELMALYWTTAGPTEAHVGREWSLFDFADRCAEAARVGYRGLGLWHADLAHILEERSSSEMRAILDDHGLPLLELEFLMDWWCEPGTAERSAADERRTLVLGAAETLAPHHIKVGNIFGRPCETTRLTETFAELCAAAAERTDAVVVYEVMPFDVNVRDLAAAVRLVDDAGAPNGGIALDTWHLGKLAITADDLRTIPAEQLRWVELSDGQVEDMDDPVAETTRHRRLPGEGEFDLRGYIAACRDIGYGGPWGVEVLSETLAAEPIEVIFDRSHAAAADQF